MSKVIRKTVLVIPDVQAFLDALGAIKDSEIETNIKRTVIQVAAQQVIDDYYLVKAKEAEYTLEHVNKKIDDLLGMEVGKVATSEVEDLLYAKP